VPISAAPIHAPLPAAPIESRLPQAVGRLSVHVRPWGYVTIPGVVNRREAPVVVSIQEGNYPVKVMYEPTSQWLTARASVRSGGHTQCFASFGSPPKIFCK
jgi:hypothetical protein